MKKINNFYIIVGFVTGLCAVNLAQADVLAKNEYGTAIGVRTPGQTGEIKNGETFKVYPSFDTWIYPVGTSLHDREKQHYLSDNARLAANEARNRLGTNKPSQPILKIRRGSGKQPFDITVDWVVEKDIFGK